MSSIVTKKNGRKLPTIREIAESNGLSAHHVNYVVDRYNIQHAATAGNIRVFDKNAVNIILRHREDIALVRGHHDVIRDKRRWDRIVINWLNR